MNKAVIKIRFHHIEEGRNLEVWETNLTMI